MINLPIVQYDFSKANSIIVNISSFKGEYSALNTIDFYYAGIIGILIELCLKEYSFRKNIKCSFKSGDIFLSDYTDTPILFLNKIIIPSRLANTNLKMIIDHENVHKDNKHIFIKMLALLSCLLNWYNILAWASFKLFSNDLEMRTDEIVIDKYSYTKKEYCEKLLEYISIKKKKMTINPSFANNDILKRINHLANYHHQKLYSHYLLILMILAISLLVPFS